jgi:DNA invertase Pin-like site-specific DNA recombinase
MRQASGRESHSHKITVYLSSAEFLELERAKLTLRSYGISADRGRIVREALAVLLADLNAGGEDSLIVRRLHEGH